MAAVISVDPATNSNTLGAVTGVRSNQLNTFNSSLLGPYTFPKPKTGLIATIFPSENTVHPLFNHDYLEIATQIYAVMEAPNITNKQEVITEVRDVVVNSYVQSATARIYQILIVGTLLLIFLIYIGKNVTFVVIGTVVLAALAWYDAEYNAPGRGTTYWNEFYTDFNTKSNSFEKFKVLEMYSNDKNKQLDRETALAQSRSGYRNNGFGNANVSLPSALLGSALTSAFK